LVGETGFADAGFAGNQEQPPTTVAGVRQSIAQLREFSLTPDKDLKSRLVLLRRVRAG
jgi:hypothetical protein